MRQKKESLKSIVYHETLDGIIKGEYKANQILNEQELVEKFGFSKSPVREALIALCNEGVLRNIPRYGYEVVRLTSRDVNEMMSYRCILEGGILRDNYEKFTPEQIDELSRLDDLCNMTTNDVWVHWEHNTNFHLYLVSCGNNIYVIQQLRKTLDVLKRAYAQYYWDRWDTQTKVDDMRYHHNIIECIKRKDIEGVLENLRLDLKDFTNF
ncbi:MAG: GntR family transcriptional regulator [Eubacteriales bacterium]|nr:GntR family transcriptional regulator [Eubacteriales bacterium]